MKKRISLIFLFSLFIFLSSCKNPVSPPLPPDQPGYGRIRVQVSDTVSGLVSDIYQPDTAGATARTLLPALAFDRYVYMFRRMSGTAEEKAPDSNGYFTLEVGTYTVAVSAFIGTAAPYMLAASGVSAEFTVGPGDNDPVVVPLRAAAEGQGEFRYTISYPPGAVADISLRKWPDMASIGLTPAHVADENGVCETLALEAGSYLLTVQASKDGRIAGVTEAVYIYPAMPTVYDKVFTDDDFHITPQTVMPDRFLYYWIDEHGSLVTTHNGQTTIAPAETLAIAAQGAGYSVQEWYLNGAHTGQSGETYYFTAASPGNYTVGLFVTKNAKLYNTNIIITVETDEDIGEPEPVTRTITIDMYDSIGDGWNGGGALRINVNGINIANVKVAITNAQNIPSGQKNTNTYTFPVAPGDLVQVYWVAGANQGDNSFIVYYTDTPPSPPFTTDNKGPQNWSGVNALLYRTRGYAPAGLSNVADGALLGSFTVDTHA